MPHYTFSATFRAVYDRAAARFAKGGATATSLLEPADVAFLAANGVTTQHLFDYVDDLANYGEPSFDQAHGIELVRRDYFLNVQDGRPSSSVLDAATLPAKSDTVRGIPWLPRLLPKARAKLVGELPSSLMYGCGGDRAFFAQHDILPHEFLSLVWRHENDDHAIIDWVARRVKSR
ncbi:MAG: DUF5069 domain-containing protein [Undibacterium sp.]|nr:DUF5069 domain-containing protein [Opitutaceae bacterium]